MSLANRLPQLERMLARDPHSLGALLECRQLRKFPLDVVPIFVKVCRVPLVKVVPVFAKQYSEGGQDLPELTQIVIDFSNFFES